MFFSLLCGPWFAWSALWVRQQPVSVVSSQDWGWMNLGKASYLPNPFHWQGVDWFRAFHTGTPYKLFWEEEKLMRPGDKYIEITRKRFQGQGVWLDSQTPLCSLFPLPVKRKIDMQLLWQSLQYLGSGKSPGSPCAQGYPWGICGQFPVVLDKVAIQKALWSWL